MKRTLAILSLVLIGLSGAGVALAAIPSADGSIKGCYAKNTQLLGATKGDLRVVDQAEACRNSENSLTWSQRGPQGQQGLQGEQGEQGEQGPAGTTATSNVFFAALGEGETQGVLLGHSNDPKTVLALDLPAGTYVVESRIGLSFGTTLESSSFTRCKLPGSSASTQLDSADRPGDLQSSATEQIEITAAIDHAGGDLVLTCKAFTPVGDTTGTTVDHATLLATPVGQVGG